MYLLDTNVISDLMRPISNEWVQRWFVTKSSSEVFVPVVALAEIVFGIERLPQGRRRRELEMKFHDLQRRAFRNRVVDFDEAAAICCGEIRARAMTRGRITSFADAQIAATALIHSMTVATRDLSDFAAFGVPLVDPFDPKASP